MQQAPELLALVPCGHRATCGPCTARLLLPALMRRWATTAAGAAGPGASAACPICRAAVTSGLRVFDC